MSCSLSVASVLSAEMHSREECRTSVVELEKVSASCSAFVDAEGQGMWHRSHWCQL